MGKEGLAVPICLYHSSRDCTYFYYFKILTHLESHCACKMRPLSSALTVHSAGAEIQLTSITLDNIQPTEAVVEIHATGICHTDLSCMEGKLPAEFPNVLGHEGK